MSWKSVVIAVIAAMIGASAGAAATYWPTREKWTEIGRTTGEVHGRAEVMQALCGFAEGGTPPDRAADYALNVKAESLAVFRTETGLRVYCK
ncbi:MAG: hypothetical protein C0606_05675 [Hyphomicrobiales bacterium]|nr:MAG: hypothetical protein C0606_05675 [Hyphomicrobiales bacterium]